MFEGLREGVHGVEWDGMALPSKMFPEGSEVRVSVLPSEVTMETVY